MFRAGQWVAVVAFVIAMAWVGVALTAQEPKPGAPAADAKPVDLTALKEAVASAAKRGENVDEIRTALAALEKALPTIKAGAVSPELQALRDAVDSAGRKGENVEAITKELLAVEMAVAGKSLAKPKPQPKPEPMDPAFPNPRPGFPNPGFPNPIPVFPNPFPANPGIGGGGIDVEMFNKAMELRKKALDMLVQGRRDPEATKEAQKLLQEATEMMMKATRGNGAGGIGIAPVAPLFPDMGVGRIPDRARLGIRIERLPPIAVEQLGLEPNMGIAVSLVTPNSAAEKAGLKLHDIIVEFAGKPVTDNTEDFIRRVNEIKTGEKVDIVVLRKGKKTDVKGVELPEPNAVRPINPRIQPLPAPGGLPLPGLLPAQPNIAPIFPPLGANVPRVPPPNALALPAGFNNVSYTSTDAGFTLKAAKGEIKYVVSGTIENGRASFGKAVIDRDGKTQTFEAADKLPAEFKADIEALLATVEPRK